MATAADSEPTPPPDSGGVTSLVDERLLTATLEAARVLLDALASHLDDEGARLLDGASPSVDLALEARIVHERIASLVAHRLEARPGRRAALGYQLRGLGAMLRRRAEGLGER